MRWAAAVLCLVLGARGSIEVAGVFDIPLASHPQVLALGSTISFGAFLFCLRNLTMLLPALALGAAASYLGIVLGLTIAAEIDDSLGQLNLWLPLVLLVLIPVAAPLLAGAGAAGICVACAATDDSNSHSGNGNLADP